MPDTGPGPGDDLTEPVGDAARVFDPPEMRGPWRRYETRLVHRNPWFWVRRDTVDRPNGDRGDYFVVESTPAVFIVALDDHERVALVGLHRYPTNKWSLEVPAGSADPGEDPLDAAKRELAEETGLAAAEWHYLGLLHPANGLLAEDNHIYLARRLTTGGGHEQEAEGIEHLDFYGLGDAIARCGTEIADSQTVSALLLVAKHLGKLNL
jgi:8-oxo-dGTP pyrophosphatase MutT (NUDIX family)